MTNQALLDANIIDLLGLQNLPEERKGQLLGRMIKVVQDRVTDRVVATMTAEQRGELDALLAGRASAEDIDALMKRAVPNFDAISAEELVKFKREMQENTQAVRSMVEK